MVLSNQHAALPADVLLSDSWYTSPIQIYRNRDNQLAVMFNSDNARGFGIDLLNTLMQPTAAGDA